ncbi:4-hydroxy-tetrahydrodipicolinate reductase [Flavisolibacter tropicus]|uniref:4-hydroxy-tetrahydrodipicolinate reductase n=1 Tax=Flavisolibacter tropicus TaxID=1492898 RepID=A0A172TT07_9BACT|nr:4-hydroxy-tetrahydrodipicolinate reductase [Flavisolibacter tropicus]ANE50034.1 dihydrodipicolinate reductase [Flavisolibacter tropicus]
MRIALIGYGKMGQLIEEIALEKGHTITLRISEDNLNDFTAANLADTDVAIEFTAPHAAYDNVKKCIDFGVPVVCGSTGWNAQLPEMKEYCQSKGGAFLHSSNFSIGVNIFFEVNSLLAKLMAKQPSYEVAVKEIHHTHKKDAPSGTAVTIAEQILQHITRKQNWVNTAEAASNELSIVSERIDPAPGTHEVKYTSEIDDIEIIHTAHNRKGFASGAVLAAEFLKGKKGVFNMKDVLSEL